MKYNCEMIRDLLPLYQDGICSESSRQAIEEHLSECPECCGYLEMERSGDALENMINLERNSVLNSQANFFKRKSAVAGTVIAGIFMLPVLICLIVNLAQGGLSWFLIVLAAMLIPFSLVAVPLLAPENKALWSLGSFTVSLMLLLAVCCICAGGHWFFIAATAALFGMSVLFGPFAVRAKPVAAVLGNHKALAVMSLTTGLFLAMMWSIGMTCGLGLRYYTLAAAISLPILGWIWALFLIIRYAPLRKLIKAAACMSATGILLLVLNLTVQLSARSAQLCIETFGKTFSISMNTVQAIACFAISALLVIIFNITKNHRR